jgi:hypothetical protein
MPGSHTFKNLGYKLPHGAWIGADAYYLKHIADPARPGCRISDSPERVAAIGPAAVWDLAASPGTLTPNWTANPPLAQCPFFSVSVVDRLHSLTGLSSLSV